MNYSVAFDSFSEFVTQAAEGKSEMPERHRSSRQYDYDDWAGGSFEKCVQLSKFGWKEGAGRVEKMAAPLLEQISSHMRKPEIIMDIEGGDLDIGTYLSGYPEPFMRWDDTEVLATAHGRFVHVVVNCAASAFYSTEQLFSKGAAVAILVDALEMSGHRVTVDVCEWISPSGGGYDYYGYGCKKEDLYEIKVRVKNPEDPLNLESVAFACAHSGMLRRMIFSLNEQSSSEIREYYGFTHHGGYGRPVDPSTLPDCDIYVGASNSELIAEPVNWARKQLKAQGVEFTDES